MMEPVAAALALLLAVFAGAIAINLLRGREIDCGCFGFGVRRRIGWDAVVRNVVLALLAVGLATRPPEPLALDTTVFGGDTTMSASDAFALLIASTLAVAAFAIIEEARRIRRTVRFVAGAEAVT